MKNWKSAFIIFYFLSINTFLTTMTTGQLNATEATRWPMPDWETFDNKEKMKTAACQNFKKMATATDTFLTDGLVIIKDGRVHFEYYDSKHGPNTPHALWSVTKTITGALLGITERDGRINSDHSLSDFFPDSNNDPNYQKITMNHLLYMDAGFVWDEDVKEVNQNPLIKMLYGKGHEDMVEFALSRKLIKEGPAYKWNYSTGIPTITMGVLKKIYGADDETMPWRNLFHPLGMKSAVFEKDNNGNFIGGSSFFASPRDLAKLGYLYLNNGFWNGEVLLPKEWITKMLTPSPGYLSPGTVIKDITKEGVYGGSLWLNRVLKKTQGKPYPNAPEDMYLAIGFNGQFLVVIPSLKMILARTGHDKEFHSKMNEFISRAIQCFHDPSHVVGKSSPAKNPITMGLGQLIKNVKNSIEANTLQATLAKTICSCHYVSNLDIPACVKRNHFSLSRLLTKISVRQTKQLSGEMVIQVKLSRFARLFKLHYGNSAKAVYNPDKPQFGCTLK